MCLSLASLRYRILSLPDVRTTLSKKLRAPEAEVECMAECRRVPRRHIGMTQARFAHRSADGVPKAEKTATA
jgi:hypothetical protein